MPSSNLGARIRQFALHLLLGLLLVPSWSHAGWLDDTINVTVRIQDEVGVPIPYVTVWRAVEYDTAQVKSDGQFQYLRSEDLKRITLRYAWSHDIASRFGDKPIPTLGIASLGDAEGVLREEINYTDQTGRGNNFQRPDPLRIAYSFIKKGYFPGFVDFSVPRSQQSAQAVVTLKRNPDEALESASYMMEFARLRYELSKPQDRSMTVQNQRRFEEIARQFEQAAQDAIAAGDKRYAARIYARMRYLPSVKLGGDATIEIRGISMGDAASEQARRAMEMAYQLDPDNLFVKMNSYGRGLTYPSGATKADRIRINLPALEKLISEGGTSIWPFYYAVRAASYVELGDYAKARQLYLDAARLEPRYTDWNKAIKDMKLRMKMLMSQEVV